MSPSAAAVSLVEPSHILHAGCWTAGLGTIDAAKFVPDLVRLARQGTG